MTAIGNRPTSSSIDQSADDSLLRFALRADATLTGLVGLILAATAEPLSALTGLTAAQEFGLGAAFVLYGFAVFGLSALGSMRNVGVGTAVGNVVFTVAAVAVVVTGTPQMTGLGVTLTLATGAFTAFFAWLQYLGARRLAA
jgi:hypothetical protein